MGRPYLAAFLAAFLAFLSCFPWPIIPPIIIPAGPPIIPPCPPWPPIPRADAAMAPLLPRAPLARAFPAMPDTPPPPPPPPWLLFFPPIAEAMADPAKAVRPPAPAAMAMLVPEYPLCCGGAVLGGAPPGYPPAPGYPCYGGGYEEGAVPGK